MALPGIERRLRRLQGANRGMLWLALDHGLPAGPLPGIENPAEIVRRLRATPITGLIANPGLVRFLDREAASVPGLVVHLSAGTTLGLHPTSKVLSAPVERAVALGADAVSVQVHFAGRTEDRALSDAGSVVDAATAQGLPVIAMAHVSPSPGRTEVDGHALSHAVRASAELGARVVQTPYPGSREAFRDVIRSCPVPVLVSGGPAVSSPEAWLGSIRDAIAEGASGLAVGRNLFENSDPRALAARLGEIVFGGVPKPSHVGA